MKMNPKNNLKPTSISLIGLVILIAGAFWYQYYNSPNFNKAHGLNSQISNPLANPLTPATTDIKKAAAEVILSHEAEEEKKQALANLDGFLKKEASRIGTPIEDPEKEELRLRNIAQNLSEENLKFLEQKVLDTTLNGDERAMAATLISWSGRDEALMYLAKIAVHPIALQLEARTREQEVVLRLIAIEAFAEFGENSLGAIKSIENLMTDKTLIERLQRVKLALRLNNPASVKKNDEDALKKIQEK